MPANTSVNPILLFVVVFSTCLIAACSGSDSGNIADSEGSVPASQDIAGTIESTDLLDDVATPLIADPSPDPVDQSPDTAPDPVTEPVGTSQLDMDTDAGVIATEECVESPVDPDIARVRFNMTVPAYVSDALQVEIESSSSAVIFRICN